MAMTTALFTHPACLDHDSGPGHPESAARLRAVLRALEAPEFTALQRREAPRASLDDIAAVHGAAFVHTILAAVPAKGWTRIDGDTALSPGSGEAALRAAGAAVAAVEAVMAGEVANAFCAVRPPGHHAEPDRAMGFCLFNNVAIGAMRARALGARRVAVIDFDVHHGNGTEAFFWNDANLFYASTHQSPLYPGTGAVRDQGAFGNIVNCPLPAGSGGGELRAAFHDDILPALDRFAPDLILISAGFDGHRADPLAGLHLTEADFAWATNALCVAASRHCRGRVVSLLEGGYDLEALAASAAAHVAVLMAHRFEDASPATN